MGLSLSNYFEALSSKIEYNAPIRQKRIKEITAILSNLPEIEELNKRFYDLSEEEELIILNSKTK